MKPTAGEALSAKQLPRSLRGRNSIPAHVAGSRLEEIMRFLSVRRLPGRAGVIAVALAAGSAGFASPVSAGAAIAAGGVSPTPVNGTPQLVAPSGNQATENVRQLVKCGSLIYAVGDFKTITWGGHTHTRNGIFSFSATAPFTLSKMLVGVNGTVNSIAFTRHRGCADAYIGGSFTSVHGTSAKNIAEINTSTGAVVKTFGHNANGTVNTLIGYNNHLLAGGTFTRTNGHSRNYYASLNPFSGKDDGFLRLRISGRVPDDPTKIYNQQLSHGGNLLLVEGNFTSAGGKQRQQIFMLNLSGSEAKVTGWTSPEFSQHCRTSESFYLRAAAWSPNDSTVYTATTGFHLLNWQSGSFPLTGLCDTVAAFPATHQSVRHRWIQYSGCDSYYSVGADSTNVYAAGHPRWTHNANGCNKAGPGAIPDKGLQGFSAGTGSVRVNSHGTGLYSMARANADDMIFTSAGLWIASSNRFNANVCGGVSGHRGICLLPK
jgi:hypothetical protein